jgi:hypothetical protein
LNDMQINADLGKLEMHRTDNSISLTVKQ